jgi:hypothetical protein
MATDLYDEREKRVEKATALLTLAADKGKVRGSCLKGEEMAALIDGRSGGTASSGNLAHLSSCDRCYSEWLFLKKNVPQEVPRGRLYHLSRWKKLRYLGTALAAAASIAVYLNVVKMGDKAVEQAVIPQTMRLPDQNLAVPPLSSADKEETDKPAPLVKETPAVLSPAPLAAPQAMGSGTAKGRFEVLPAPRRSVAEPPEERPKPAAITMPAERKEAKDLTADSAQSMAESVGAPTAVPATEDKGDWLEQLHAACLSGRDEAQFWRDMAARGMRLQASQVGIGSGVAEAKMATVLALVQGITGPDTAPQQCRLILAELAKQSGNR